MIAIVAFVAFWIGAEVTAKAVRIGQPRPPYSAADAWAITGVDPASQMLYPCPHGNRFEPKRVKGCGKAGRKDGEAFVPEGGNWENQYWVCPDGHRWTSGRPLTPKHDYEDVADPASHLARKHAVMVSVFATSDSMRQTHQKEHAER